MTEFRRRDSLIVPSRNVRRLESAVSAMTNLFGEKLPRFSRLIGSNRDTGRDGPRRWLRFGLCGFGLESLVAARLHIARPLMAREQWESRNLLAAVRIVRITVVLSDGCSILNWEAL